MMDIFYVQNEIVGTTRPMAAISASIFLLLTALELKMTLERVQACVTATALMASEFSICIFLRDKITIFT